jgi:hypothetical protein
MSWAAIILAAASAAAPPSARPLQLQVDDSGSQVIIRLVGESPTAFAASYELEVTGGSSGSSNRSIQRGTARLQAGQSVTVATLRLRNSTQTRWIARLHVTPSAGAAYDVQWRSAP